MRAAEAWRTFGVASRVGFEAALTLMVWICVYWQSVIVRASLESSVELCGAGAAMVTLALAAFWGITLLALVYDSVQAYRGKLSRAMKWLRTFPATAFVLLVPVVLFLT